MIGYSRRAVLRIYAASVIGSSAPARASRILGARDFVDTVGVNTHLSAEPYASRFPLVRDLLIRSGIRHVRDELRPSNNLDHWRDLFSAGLRSHLLVSPATNTVGQMLAYIRELGVERITAIEGQNEGDSPWFLSRPESGGNWSAVVVDYQRAVHEALRRHYPAKVLPLISPSVLNWKPDDMMSIRGAAEFSDLVAVHSYVQGAQEPETEDSYAALSWYLRVMRDPFKPGADVMATETGYNNLVKPGASAVSERAAAIYIPRLLLHNFQAGIRRTFLYQLLDGGDDPADSEHHWGLVRHDNTPKPAYHAVSALLAALRDDDATETSAAQARATHAALDIMLPGAATEVRSPRFAKADGSVVLALWRALRSWDPVQARDIAVTPQRQTVATRPAAAGAMSMSPSTAPGVWNDVAVTSAGFTVPLDDNVLLVRLTI